nr:hypothetical protein [Tanacetum cinerariifolium]
MDNKKHIVNLESFRDMLHICLRVHGQSFAEPPFEEEILAFIHFLGHSAVIRMLTNVNINKLYQPCRSFAAIINKCLTGKSFGYDSLRLSQAQILWGLYHKRNMDYAYLMWKDFVYQSTARIETTYEEIKILATVDGKPRTISKSSIRRNLKLDDEAEISSLPDAELFENLALMGRARIAQSSALPTVVDEPVSPLGDDSQAQDLEITSLKARIKLLEDKDGGGAEPSGEDATIKGKSLETREEAAVEKSTERASNNIKDLVNVLTSLDAASILTSGVRVVSVPPAAKVSTVSVPTGSGMVPAASPIFTTASLVTPYARRKGKEKMVESDIPKKKKLQEQTDVHMAREIEEQMAREDQRRSEQIARDAEIARIHEEEELQMLIDGLDGNNETIAKYLQEYEQFAADLSIREKIDLISELVKYQDYYAKDNAKKMKTSKEVSKEDLKQMMQLVPVEELWTLVRETLSIRQATSDKEKELWVKLKRLYEPDVEDQLWTYTQALMHDPVEWRLYDTCGVHHVLSRDQEIFMLVEKDYPLRKELAIVMIRNKLQVENYSQMASDLI